MKKIILSILILSVFFDAKTQDSTAAKKNVYKHFIIPTTLSALAFYSRANNVPLNKYDIRDFRNRIAPNFHTPADDYLQWVPIGAAYALEFTSLKSKSDLLNKTILLAKSEFLMILTVYPLKTWIGDRRPDSGARNAFPSGHTTQAFVAAAFLAKEYGKENKWISILSYSCATSVALIRVLNDRHWSADVFAGAALGILCVNTAYLTHQYKWSWGKKKNQNAQQKSVFLPYFSSNNGGAVFMMNF